MNEIYFYEKKYDNENVERKAFKTTHELINYMQDNQKILFNAGFRNAEIKMYRVRVEG